MRGGRKGYKRAHKEREKIGQVKMDEVFWKRNEVRHATPFIVIVVDKLLWALKETGPRTFLKVIYVLCRFIYTNKKYI